MTPETDGGQFSPSVGNQLKDGFAFRVVPRFGASLRLCRSPQTLRDLLTSFLKHRTPAQTNNRSVLGFLMISEFAP
jgi:hypothetical protein